MLELKGKSCKDCKIMIDDVEEEALSLIYNILDTNVFENTKIRIMPDVHAGKGIVIGFTAPLTNAVNPCHVGVDIGCCITTYITDTKVNPEEYPIIEHRIKKAIPMGFELNSKRVFDMKDFLKFLKKEYSAARAGWPEMIDNRTFSEKEISKILQRIGQDEGVFYKSISSLGGGNHFIEVGVTPSGEYAFTVHCGSRNFGLKVCKYWEKVTKSQKIDSEAFSKALEKLKAETDDLTTLPEKIKQMKKEYALGTPKEYLQGENMKGYLSDMVVAQAYAKYNHKIIGEKISEIFKKVNGAKVVSTVQSIHNYINFSDHIIRKGAISAKEGELMVVPFNMRDGLAICVGKGNEDWNCSCAHGAGRKMSRSKAKELVTMEEYQESMKDIYTTSVCRGTLDESPMAYKDTQTIYEHIKDTCEISYMVKPVINIKASDGGE